MSDAEKRLEGLLTFEPNGPTTLLANAQRVFRPQGLMLWGVKDHNVESALIGRNLELVASFGLVPAAWFAVSANYDQVVRSFAEGKDPGRGWGSWSTVYPGQQVRLIFDRDARDVRALMWGHIIEPTFLHGAER